MKKHFSLILITLCSLSIFSQINYEKGYYINNQGNKIEGLIKNIDWQNNPTYFEFKTSELAENQTIKIESAKEFGVYNFNKYERHSINMDRSSEFLNNISQEKNPKFVLETLFLKVLIEGNAKLLQYTDKSLNRYFFSVNQSDLTQLIYKIYKDDNNKAAENNEYKQQLFNNLKCDAISTSNLLSVDYNKKDLVKVFKKYNTCSNSENITYEEPKIKRDIFNLSIRPGVSFSSLSLVNTSSLNYTYSYENKTLLKIGLEAELILPFNKNKWSFIFEPTYQNEFKGESFNHTGRLRMSVNYKCWQLPVGIRYYFHLGNNSSLFLNGIINYDLVSNDSKFLYEEGSFVAPQEFNFDNPILKDEIKINNSLSFGIGIGYLFKNKISTEIRFFPSKRISNSNDWKSNYNLTTFSIGYRIF